MDGLGRLRNVLWACLVAVCLAVSAQAQTASGPDYDAWEAVAQRAELTIEQGNVSEARLDRLRSSLVVWRTRFEDAAGANDPRADTLREQIAAQVVMGRLASPGEIADTVWFAAQHPVINGAVLHANLGQVER